MLEHGQACGWFAEALQEQGAAVVDDTVLIIGQPYRQTG